MRRSSFAFVMLLGLDLVWQASIARAQSIESTQTLVATIRQLIAIVEPAADAPARTFTTQVKFTKADGLPSKILDATLDLAYQAPDRLRLTAVYDGQTYHLA